MFYTTSGLCIAIFTKHLLLGFEEEPREHYEDQCGIQRIIE